MSAPRSAPALNPQIRAHYVQLQARVSDFFARVLAQNSSRMKCAQGCYNCCANGLTVSGVEAQAILDFLKSSDEVLKRIEDLQIENPHRDLHCKFLSAEGHCQIYEVRPLVCRSHGAPVQYRHPENDTVFRDVCPLNFEDIDLDQLATSEVLNMETVNTLLSILNSQFDRDRAQEPYPMKDLIARARKERDHTE